jgi:hypothetical protein
MASTPSLALAGFVRGVREEGLKALPLIAGNVRFGSLDGFDRQEASPSARASPICCV